MAGSEVDQLLAGTFHVIMDKIEADLLNFQSSGIENESSYFKNTF